MEEIRLKNINTHNLKGIDVKIPLNQLTVVTGISGSGKSSLVFDTLYGEAYRRYLESLSSYARQYLQALPKPDVEEIENLPPAIAVQQHRSGANRRSTVGTMTELQDYIQMLFVHLGQPYCLDCNTPIVAYCPDSLVNWLFENAKDKSVTILSPLSAWSNLKAEELKEQLRLQGFSRLWCETGILPLDQAPTKDLHSHKVAVDRIKIQEDRKLRLHQSLRLAYTLSKGWIEIFHGKNKLGVFCEKLICHECHESLPKPSVALFSFNHPLGACQCCQGYGAEAAIDWNKVLPDADGCLDDEDIAALNFGSHKEYYSEIRKAAKVSKIPLKKAFGKYKKRERDWLLFGDKTTKFRGLTGYFEWLQSQSYKPHYRMHKAKYTQYVECHQCHGSRLRKESLCFRIGQETVATIRSKSLESLLSWLLDLAKQTSGETKARDTRSGGKPVHEASQGPLSPIPDSTILSGVAEAIDQAILRIGYLIDIGLSYLWMDRLSTTLSGGELQRIHMARCLSSGLTDTLFCLDEPTVGLHPKDCQALLSLMQKLSSKGNTVVVVEHDQHITENADHLIEIGPKAGEEGGEVIYAGKPIKPKLIEQEPLSKDDHWQPSTLKSNHAFLRLQGACTNNLKNVSCQIPLQRVTGICGVSGSGKSSLIHHTLYPCLQDFFDGKRQSPVFKELELTTTTRLWFDKVGLCESVHMVNQASLGRSSRSNIITYLGLFEPIRKLFASQESALARGLTPGSFSFNVAGGRCETCKGLGTVEEDLSFLGVMEVTCPSCQGQRFQEEVLEVKVFDLNLIDVLNLTVKEAYSVFHEIASLRKTFKLVMSLGMGYMRLGQHTSSFSGGEAQRLKLLGLLRQMKDNQKSCLIFDEPTSGLSDSDAGSFMEYLHTLAHQGHTIIMIEHHLKSLKQTDYLLELGPGAAEDGGNLLYQGPTAEIRQCSQSITAPFFK